MEIIQADAAECLLLGKADSSKVVNLTNMSGCFRPEAVTHHVAGQFWRFYANFE
jgi:hypothetical protein